MSELRECPFCQSTDLDQMTERGLIKNYKHWIECLNCGIRGPEDKENMKGAIESWNYRASKLT